MKCREKNRGKSIPPAAGLPGRRWRVRSTGPLYTLYRVENVQPGSGNPRPEALEIWG